jgi:NAD+ kinase
MSAPKLGLIANTRKPGARELVDALRGAMARQGVPLRLECRTAALMGESGGCTAHDLAHECDLLIVLGGDGTLLQVVRELGHRLPPIFGINLGSLGFLTSVSSEDWDQAVECLLAGDYRLSHRTLLSVQVWRSGAMVLQETALNDAVLSRGELSRLVKIDVLIDGVSLTEYNADGLIVATPTGSTAYSLSAGGPVLTPDSGVFVIAPICPHVLTMRPVIVSDGALIEMAPSREQIDMFLTLDGQNAVRVETGDRIRLTKAAHRLALAMLPGMTFFEVLRQKLKWSGTAV